MALVGKEEIRGIDSEKLNNLLDVVLERRLQPEDKYEIAALLESKGWTDDRAAEEFGAENVFELAAYLWDIGQERFTAVPLPPASKMGFFSYMAMVLRSFLRGMIFALPMAISVLAMLILRFSLWSYENLSLELATAIAIGTIMSFMAVGGFTQAIARRGFLYIKLGYYNMARRITYYFVRLGYLVCSAIFLVFLVFNAFFGVFPFRMVVVILLYFIFLSAIWLSVTVMYILQRELAFTGLLAAGIFTVYIFFVVLKFNIIVSQIISLCLVSIAGVILAVFFFISAERKLEKGIAPSLPRASITIYTVLPYFIYGFLYFTFLFMDRIIAWSTSNVYMPYLIWFRGPYEMGLDLALITLILPMGFIEVVVNEFMANLETHQKNYKASRAAALGMRYLGIYLRRIYLVVLFSAATAAAVYLAVRFIHLNPVLPLEVNLLSSKITHFVFIAALAGYTVLCAGLMNALILFSLSQPEMVGRSILWGLVANIVVGFPLSRWFDHHFAVLGLLFGAAVFLATTCRGVVKVLKNLDYYLYAAS
ncbi:MAG: hypothetical protein QHH10_01560 [Peptococcaceae bacterium]|jgi:hypothetical protein|nr:hypothetical protein [Peptococcaceae bacterium]MDH7523982.1 hypothetical protein [Peptococcaceae bacterium]